MISTKVSPLTLRVLPKKAAPESHKSPTLLHLLSCFFSAPEVSAEARFTSRLPPAVIAFLRVFCLVLVFLGLVSCRSGQRLVKAFAVEPSAFLQHPTELKKTEAAKSPFLREWRSSDAAAWKKAASNREIHIAPVSLAHLRPMNRPLSQIEITERSRQRNAQKLAERFRDEVTQACTQKAGDKLKALPEPNKKCLTLELAIIEFNPNTFSGGVLRRGINILLWAGAETLVSHKLKGSMAIEGRLRDLSTGKTLYEFADHEQNRSGLILYYHDYTHYSFARKMIREWATQIASSIGSGDRPVLDSSPVTFLFW
jgi:Protein of unknown function (DUF3313)